MLSAVLFRRGRKFKTTMLLYRVLMNHFPETEHWLQARMEPEAVRLTLSGMNGYPHPRRRAAFSQVGPDDRAEEIGRELARQVELLNLTKVILRRVVVDESVAADEERRAPAVLAALRAFASEGFGILVDADAFSVENNLDRKRRLQVERMYFAPMGDFDGFKVRSIGVDTLGPFERRGRKASRKKKWESEPPPELGTIISET